MSDETQNGASAWAPERGSNGQFLPGHGGRPRGSRNAISRNALVAVQNLSSLAIFKLRERIDSGDMAAIRLCLEFTLPRGGRTIEINSDAPSAWADAMAEGDISPTEAATAAQALVKLNEVGEIVELTKRLTELEALISDQRIER
jgi:hypothetical protein